ncbi:MAG: 1-deoxy-D-xylulose-5-phosphate reductoisomerase [Planctomycetota bacterium]
MPRRILVLGSTGSIGTQTLALAREAGSGLSVVGLAAQRSWEPLLRQVEEFRPQFVAVADPEAAAALRPRLSPGTTLLEGGGAARELARIAEYDVAVHGIVGAAGLEVSVEVLRRGLVLALANKESLVIAGALLMALAREHGGAIVPVDSEHSAIFQCLRGEDLGRVRKVLLTASGGPFRTSTAAEIAAATPEGALAHPNWAMGPRVTIGSATLMNKALEVIELHHLFGLGADRIEVVVHPQSLVHSLVEFVDGSVIAQLGPPDMRGPIHYALHHPDRAPASLVGFDLALFRRLDFEAPDLARFPALGLGFRCVTEGSDAGAVLNAADEIAVEAFLARRIGLAEIAEVNRAVLDGRRGSDHSFEALLEADAHARAVARTEVERRTLDLAEPPHARTHHPR